MCACQYCVWSRLASQENMKGLPVTSTIAAPRHATEQPSLLWWRVRLLCWCLFLCAAWVAVQNQPHTRRCVRVGNLRDPSAARALAFKFEIYLCSSFSLQPCIILHWLDSLPCTSAPHQKYPAKQGSVSVEHTDLSLTPCWRSIQSRGIGRSLLK